MRRGRNAWLAYLGASTLAVVALGSCVDEKIVYRDGPNFTTPPAAAVNFVGYSDEAAKKTVCGACHSTQQAKWLTTKHASAWADLQGSPAKQALCEACHTVSANGNLASGNAGWTSTQDKRYHDVQCESCHGAGLSHVGGPARGQMLAAADPNATGNGCAECHSGTHQPFVEEWKTTRHATSYSHMVSGNTINTCGQSCHVGQGVLAAWGVNTNYLEAGKGTANAPGIFGVGCVVCHDPHGSANGKQLRFAVDARDPEMNLCTKCHNRRGNPDFKGNRDSPHAPQGPLLFGSAGWWPPGLDFDETESTHGSDRNPKLCATCHVQNYTAKDNNNVTVQVVGHRFLPIPCVNTGGLPTTDQNCTDAQRSFRSCAASGCHASEGTARTAFETAESDIEFLAGALSVMIDEAPASEKLTTQGCANAAACGPAFQKLTTARGSLYNYNLALTVGAAAHNPFLVKALLKASMAQLAKDYNITPPFPLSRLAPYDKVIPADSPVRVGGAGNKQ